MKHYSIAIILSILILTTSCGNNKSEFDRVISDTIIEADLYENHVAPQPQPRHKPESVTEPEIQPEPETMAETTGKSEFDIKSGPRFNDRIHINNIGHLRDVFNDSNHHQLPHAQRLGIKPVTRLRDLYRTRRPIVKVISNEYYTVDSLRHSFPYLVPEAEALLRTIGANFIDSLHSRGADGYKIIVTSLLRTPASVKKLRRVNRNATENSTHQYATTFDITYSRFDCADTTRTIHQGDLKNLLAEVLNDLRGQGRCKVKFERHTACYHITAQ